LFSFVECRHDDGQLSRTNQINRMRIWFGHTVGQTDFWRANYFRLCRNWRTSEARMIFNLRPGGTFGTNVPSFLPVVPRTGGINSKTVVGSPLARGSSIWTSLIGLRQSLA